MVRTRSPSATALASNASGESILINQYKENINIEIDHCTGIFSWGASNLDTLDMQGGRLGDECSGHMLYYQDYNKHGVRNGTGFRRRKGFVEVVYHAGCVPVPGVRESLMNRT